MIDHGPGGTGSPYPAPIYGQQQQQQQGGGAYRPPPALPTRAPAGLGEARAAWDYEASVRPLLAPSSLLPCLTCSGGRCPELVSEGACAADSVPTSLPLQPTDDRTTDQAADDLPFKKDDLIVITEESNVRFSIPTRSAPTQEDPLTPARFVRSCANRPTGGRALSWATLAGSACSRRRTSTACESLPSPTLALARVLERVELTPARPDSLRARDRPSNAPPRPYASSPAPSFHPSDYAAEKHQQAFHSPGYPTAHSPAPPQGFQPNQSYGHPQQQQQQGPMVPYQQPYQPPPLHMVQHDQQQQQAVVQAPPPPQKSSKFDGMGKLLGASPPPLSRRVNPVSSLTPPHPPPTPGAPCSFERRWRRRLRRGLGRRKRHHQLDLPLEGPPPSPARSPLLLHTPHPLHSA